VTQFVTSPITVFDGAMWARKCIYNKNCNWNSRKRSYPKLSQKLNWVSVFGLPCILARGQRCIGTPLSINVCSNC